jgi:hypothetical protein
LNNRSLPIAKKRSIIQQALVKEDFRNTIAHLKLTN